MLVKWPTLTVVDPLAFYRILWDYVIITYHYSSLCYKAMAVFHHKVHYAKGN